MTAVHGEMSELNGLFRDFLQANSTSPSGSQSGTPSLPPSTPQRKQLAMRRAQELEYELDDEGMVSLLELFETDASAADAYLVIERPALRKAWVARKLRLA